MNRFTWALAYTALVLPAFAQHVGVINPSRGMIPPAGAYQYGNILFPGGIVQQSHPARVGASISGFPPYTGVQPGAPNYPRNSTIAVPYAYPVFYPDYGYGQQQSPNVTVVVPQQPAPTVVINQNYGPEQQPPKTTVLESRESSGLRVWDGSSTKSAPQSPEGADLRAPSSVPDDKPNIYLIALKDGTIRTAIGYWVEDGTLHYVTPQSSVNHVTLDMVDRESSEQLNRERKLDFDLKSAGRVRR